jgi:hypothetical protein
MREKLPLWLKTKEAALAQTILYGDEDGSMHEQYKVPFFQAKTEGLNLRYDLQPHLLPNISLHPKSHLSIKDIPSPILLPTF